MIYLLRTLLESFRLAYGTGNYRMTIDDFNARYADMFHKILNEKKLAFYNDDKVVSIDRCANEFMNTQSIISFCVYDIEGQKINIYYIHTKKEFRSNGIATKLLNVIYQEHNITREVAHFFTIPGDKFLTRKISKNWFYKPYEKVA